MDCLDDKLQDALQGHFDYFKENKGLAQFLLIAFGMLTDALLLFFLGKWVYNGGSWRFLIALSLAYFLRFINTSLFMIRKPPGGDIWEYPGFFSITVQYGAQNDYYFNPTMSVCICLVMEFRQMKKRCLMAISLIAMLGECYLSLCFRGHYTIDNFGGIMLGAYLWLVSNNWLSYYIDVKLFGMTLHERYPDDQIQTECANC